MKDKVINDCQVFLGVIDEGDNNFLPGEKKNPDFSVLNESEWSLHKIHRGLFFYLCNKSEVFSSSQLNYKYTSIFHFSL